jgi:tRNA dimethylallyltransferase
MTQFMTRKVHKIIILTGPTASGKSGLALSLAEKSGGVIINADSQQMYRELRILTARPTPEEEARAPHRLYGLLPGQEACSAGKWLNLARMEIDWTLGQGLLPIVVGGTGLYIRALMQGIAQIPDIDASVRQQAASDYDAMGKEAFAERLKWVDPEFFARLAVHDRQRLIRAYEVWLGSGKPLSYWQSRPVAAPYPADSYTLYRVDIPRDILYARCNARFAAMLEQGAMEEVKHLISLNLSPDLPVMKSVGVKELAQVLQGRLTLAEAAGAASQVTRHYAKRQITWFRHQFPETVAVNYAINPAEFVEMAAKN